MKLLLVVLVVVTLASLVSAFLMFRRARRFAADARRLNSSVESFVGEMDRLAKPHCCVVCARVKSLNVRAAKKAAGK